MNKEKSTPQKAYDVCYLIIGAFKNGEKLGAIEWSELEECYKAALGVRKELKARGKDAGTRTPNKLRVQRKKS